MSVPDWRKNGEGSAHLLVRHLPAYKILITSQNAKVVYATGDFAKLAPQF